MALTEHFEDFTRRDWEVETDEAPIRFAMIGLGWWVLDEAMPAVRESEYCETSVLVSGDREKAEREAAASPTVEAGITYDEFHDGVAAEHYDAVYVCTPNALHRPYVETACELGKPVLCEKPMADTVEEAEAIAEAAEAADVPLMIAYRMHTEPAVRRTKDAIAAGLIGDVIQVHGHMSDDILGLGGGADQWRLDPELSGGTTFNDIGIYPLNTTRFVLESDPTAVYAAQESVHPAFDGADEHVSFQLEFPGPVHGVYTASHNAHGSSHLSFLGSAGEIRIEPIFFPWDSRSVRVTHDRVSGEFEFEQVNQMTEEFDYFANHLHRDIDPYPDGQHGLVDMRVIETMYAAAEAGKRIKL